MIRANTKITVLAALLAVCWAGLRPAAANNLEGIGVTRLADSIAVTITTSAGCECNVFLTDSKPERIVVDLSGVVNDLPKKQFAGLPLKSIRSIRTSQFKSEPDAQARVVLDINRPIEFVSSHSGNKVTVKFAAVPDELASVDWQSSGENDYVSNTVVEAPAAQKPPVEKPAVEKFPVEEQLVVKPVEKAPISMAEVKPVSQPVEVVRKPIEPERKPQVVPEKPVENTVPVNMVSTDETAAPAQQTADVAAPESQGIQVDTTPKRKIVEYSADDEKDPFQPLVGIGTGKITSGLPSLENLKLVGILEDRSISSALLEDGEGNGYILKPNDRIQSGFLVNVTDTKAIFQITEYGWTRTVALELQVPEIK